MRNIAKFDLANRIQENYRKYCVEVRISGTIIAFNEGQNLGRCIASMWSVCDEIIVVDSGSDDDTQQIAKDLGAKLIVQPFLGHIGQKNFAVDQAQYEIVLSLDADEVLSDELINSISDVKKSFVADGYAFNRLNNFCGQWIRHGTWYPDRKLRLWRKSRGSWGGENPHDQVILDSTATVHFLRGDLLHYTASSKEEYDLQVEKFSSIQAENLHKKGLRPSLYHLYIKPLARFVTSYFLRLGFLDGSAGWHIAKTQHRLVRLRYLKVQSLNDMLNSPPNHVRKSK